MRSANLNYYIAAYAVALRQIHAAEEMESSLSNNQALASTLAATIKQAIGEITNMTEHHVIHQKLTELFAIKLNLDAPTVGTDLVGTGLLDSLMLIELLTQLEETFGVSISTDDLELDNFRSIASIAAFVARRTAVVEAV